MFKFECVIIEQVSYELVYFNDFIKLLFCALVLNYVILK